MSSDRAIRRRGPWSAWRPSQISPQGAVAWSALGWVGVTRAMVSQGDGQQAGAARKPTSPPASPGGCAGWGLCRYQPPCHYPHGPPITSRGPLEQQSGASRSFRRSIRRRPALSHRSRQDLGVPQVRQAAAVLLARRLRAILTVTTIYDFSPPLAKPRGYCAPRRQAGRRSDDDARSGAACGRNSRSDPCGEPDRPHGAPVDRSAR